MTTEEKVQLNVRLPASLIEQVNAVSIVDEVSVAQVVREALEALVDARRGDEEWQHKKREALRRQRDTLESL